MRRVLFILIVAAASTAWWLEHAKTVELESRIAALAPAEAATMKLRSEQGELRRLLPSDAERKKLSVAATEVADSEKAIRPGTPSPTHSIAFSSVGEWSAVSTWQNRGTAAPRDTVETALWAAAGGDIPQLAQLLELSPEIRGRADALLARLPPGTQAQFPNAEALIAAFTIKNIPVGPAQIVWSQQTDADEATLGVFIRNPNVAPAPISIIPAHVEEEPDSGPQMTREEAIALAQQKAAQRKKTNTAPPSLSPNSPTTLAYLSLHRTDAGWRLVVPDSAITKIARELSAPAPAPTP